ncbi:MAG: carbohydrate kinase family protein [Dehalococcoidia bacterium]
MAQALGAAVTLVTTLSSEYDRAALDGLTVISAPAPANPRYSNSYDRNGRRTQVLSETGEPLEAALRSMPADADVLIVAPAYHEMKTMPACRSNISGIALQGLLRTTDAAGRVSPHPDAWGQVRRFLAPGRFVFFSEEDTAEPEKLAAAIAASGATVFLTRAERGATLFRSHIRRQFPAIAADALEPTGAGDCFATAFLVRFAECEDIETAARFAIAAGSVAVERVGGPAAVPTRELVEARLVRVAA